jgi:hypothetical protein
MACISSSLQGPKFQLIGQFRSYRRRSNPTKAPSWSTVCPCQWTYSPIRFESDVSAKARLSRLYTGILPPASLRNGTTRKNTVQAATAAPVDAPSSDKPEPSPMRPSLAKAMKSISRQKFRIQQAEMRQAQRQALEKRKPVQKVRDNRLAEGLGDWKRGWPGGEKGLKDWVEALELNSEANWEIMKE